MHYCFVITRFAFPFLPLLTKSKNSRSSLIFSYFFPVFPLDWSFSLKSFSLHLHHRRFLLFDGVGTLITQQEDRSAINEKRPRVGGENLHGLLCRGGEKPLLLLLSFLPPVLLLELIDPESLPPFWIYRKATANGALEIDVKGRFVWKPTDFYNSC